MPEPATDRQRQPETTRQTPKRIIIPTVYGGIQLSVVIGCRCTDGVRQVSAPCGVRKVYGTCLLRVVYGRCTAGVYGVGTGRCTAGLYGGLSVLVGVRQVCTEGVQSVVYGWCTEVRTVYGRCCTPSVPAPVVCHSYYIRRLVSGWLGLAVCSSPMAVPAMGITAYTASPRPLRHSLRCLRSLGRDRKPCPLWSDTLVEDQAPCTYGT